MISVATAQFKKIHFLPHLESFMCKRKFENKFFKKDPIQPPNGELPICRLPFPNGSYRNGVYRALWAESGKYSRRSEQFSTVKDESLMVDTKWINTHLINVYTLTPTKYGSSIFLSSAMLRNINSNPMPRYKNASESHYDTHEPRLLRTIRFDLKSE